MMRLALLHKSLPIYKLLTIGFSLIILVLMLYSSISLIEINNLQRVSRKISLLRTPTANAGSSLARQVHKTLGSLHGWMLLKEERFDDELRKSWIRIRTTEAAMKRLSEYWTNPDNLARFKKIQALLNDFEKVQFEILEISNLPENIPANQLLQEEAEPLALLINDGIMHLVNFEESLDRTPEHKAILIALTKFDNSLDLALNNIRAYVASGKKKFIQGFQDSWIQNQKYFDQLNNMQPLFKSYQTRVFNRIARNREKFSKLPDQIFDLRQKEDWNQAKYLLKTKASPLEQEIIQIIDEMAANQRDMLRHDNRFMTASTANFKKILLLLTLMAIVFTIWLGLMIRRQSVEAQSLINQRAKLIDQNIMIAYLDNQGIIKDMSNYLCRALEGTKADYVGQQSYFFLQEKDKHPLYDTISKTIQTGKAWEGEIERKNSHNEKFWFYSKLIPTLNDDNNSYIGFTNILQDITDKKRLESISITDKLTNLFNRRHFDIVIAQQIKLARRNATTITLCILDIDFFKEYNDYYGHQAGDSALTQVAQTLKETLKRPDDFVFRLGGEEFGIIFNNLDAVHVHEILRRIQQNILALQIKHERSKVHAYLTVSIGAKISPSARDLQVDDFYLEADRALYEAKKKRNCIVINHIKLKWLQEIA